MCNALGLPPGARLMPEMAATGNWVHAWVETREELRRRFAGGAAAHEVMRRLLEFGDDYLELTAGLLGIVESGRGRNAATSAAPPQDRLESQRARFIDRFLDLYRRAGVIDAATDLPWPGPWRLTQASHEQLVAATARYQRAAQKFGSLLAAVAADAFDRLVAATADQDESLPAVTSLRGLHALWVDCGEQAYATAAHGGEFAAALAELLAATVELQSARQRLTEEWSQAFGMPTRTEVDAIGERLHALQRRIIALEAKAARRGRRAR